MTSPTTFEDLLAEGRAVPVEGWDFSWFEGRATEQRPSWGYSARLSDRMARTSSSLDVQTGGGEVYAGALSRAERQPGTVAATESWRPNVGVAQGNLAPFGGLVVETAEDGDLPFADGSFDLIAQRHPTRQPWDELVRVLRPGGTYLSQDVDSGSNRELYEALMGPQPDDAQPAHDRAAARARAAGLDVVDLRHEATRVEFFDIAAVVHFLRKVVWTVPDFTVDRYRRELADVHERIRRHGAFVAHSQRYLIEARKPG
ncbi:MAG TPA: class I SAM-dependent methyltransferase [Blastococcus sp.]|nr:class I SAM-dependent methyltransferase [Blastococcus sp.]